MAGKNARSDWLEDFRSNYLNWNSVPFVESEHKDFSKLEYGKMDKEGKIGQPELTLEFGKTQAKEKISVQRLSSLSQKPKQFFSTQALELNTDKLLAWHGAHVQDGFVISIPDEMDAGEICICSFAPASSAMHHIFILGKNSKVQILLEAKGKKEENEKAQEEKAYSSSSIHTDLSEAFLGEDAQLSITTVQDYSQNDLAFSHHYHTLEKFAHLEHTAACFGASYSRTRAVNHLAGVRARANSYQIFAPSQNQKMDLMAYTHHAVPGTSGKMTCRGALADSSLGLYKGKIKIDRAAPDTVSHQSGSALLLSPDCKAYIIPALEVDNDQVEAGHGASIGGLDDKELTYLRSRGLDRKEAERLMLAGFFDSLIDLNKSAQGKKLLREKIEARLKKW